MKHDGGDCLRESSRQASGELRFRWSLDRGREKAMQVPGKRAGLAQGAQNRPDVRSSWKTAVQAEPWEGLGFRGSEEGVAPGSF